jgi:hypothetical protein
MHNPRPTARHHPETKAPASHRYHQRTDSLRHEPDSQLVHLTPRCRHEPTRVVPESRRCRLAHAEAAPSAPSPRCTKQYAKTALREGARSPEPQCAGLPRCQSCRLSGPGCQECRLAPNAHSAGSPPIPNAPREQEAEDARGVLSPYGGSGLYRAGPSHEGPRAVHAKSNAPTARPQTT